MTTEKCIIFPFSPLGDVMHVTMFFGIIQWVGIPSYYISLRWRFQLVCTDFYRRFSLFLHLDNLLNPTLYNFTKISYWNYLILFSGLLVPFPGAGWHNVCKSVLGSTRERPDTFAGNVQPIDIQVCKTISIC